ncbi:hypothetical protein SLE2022_329620 [Rubroshorea leprosula]
MKSDFKFKNLSNIGDDSESWSLNSFGDVGSVHGDLGSFIALDGFGGDDVDDVAEGGEEDDDWVAGQDVDAEKPHSQRSNSRIRGRFELETQTRSSKMVNSSPQGSFNDVLETLQSTERNNKTTKLIEVTVEPAGHQERGEPVECVGASILGHKYGPNTNNVESADQASDQASFELTTKNPMINDMVTDNGKEEEDSVASRELCSFLQGLDSDSGAIQEWMCIRERNKSRKRSRKSKSCAAVYKASKLILAAPRRNRRGRPRKELTSKSSVPEFLPNSSNGVADGSLNDSNIHNCNKSIMKKINAFGAKEIWEFAKLVGAMATGKEEEILRRLEQMKARDKQHHRVNPSRKQRNGIEGEGTVQ